MDRQNRKRGRPEGQNEGRGSRFPRRNGNNRRDDNHHRHRLQQQQKEQQQDHRENSTSTAFLEDADILKFLPAPDAHHRPLGVFEFPWQKERGPFVPLSEAEGWDFRDVFFSSLVDGSSAKIGFPGDRLGRSCATFSLDGPWGPSDEDGDVFDGLDCIWGSPIRQPLLAGSAKGSNA